MSGCSQGTPCFRVAGFGFVSATLHPEDLPPGQVVGSSTLALVDVEPPLVGWWARRSSPAPSLRVMNAREHVPLAWICQKVIDEASLAHPGHSIEFEPWDDAPGDWDRDLLLDLVRTLLSNALGHSAAGEPVIVSVIEFNEEAVLSIGTRGPTIPDGPREHLFDSTRRCVASPRHLHRCYLPRAAR